MAALVYRIIRVTNNAVGYTLLEVAISVAILGLIIGIAAPRLTTQMDWAHMQTLAHELSANMELARTTAINRGVTISVYFLESGSLISGYQVGDQLPYVAGESLVTPMADEGLNETMVSINEQIRWVRFAPDRQVTFWDELDGPINTANAVIRLTSPSNGTINIVLVSNSGTNYIESPR